MPQDEKGLKKSLQDRAKRKRRLYEKELAKKKPKNPQTKNPKVWHRPAEQVLEFDPSSLPYLPPEFNFASQTPALNFYQTLLILNVLCQAQPSIDQSRGQALSGNSLSQKGLQSAQQMQATVRDVKPHVVASPLLSTTTSKTRQQQEALAQQPKVKPSNSPKPSTQLTTKHVFRGDEHMESSRVIKMDDGQEYHAKSTNGEFARQNDSFLRELGLNLNISPLQIFIAKTIVSGDDNKVVLYSLGQARASLTPDFQDILTSPAFLQEMAKKGIARGDEDGILKEVNSIFKIPFAQMAMLGIGDISNESLNIFYSPEKGFAFPDVDCFTNPTLPDIELLELMNDEEYAKLREFAIGAQYKDLAQRRLDLIKQNSSPENSEIYNILRKGFAAINKLFSAHETLYGLIKYVEKNEARLSEILDVNVENPDLSSIKLDKGKIRLNFVKYEDILPAPTELFDKKHPFLSSMNTDLEKLIPKQILNSKKQGTVL